MCGYFGNLHEAPAVIDLLNRLKIPLPYPTQRAYQRRNFSGLITAGSRGYECRNAIWWYSLRSDEGTLVPNDKLTSFNARDLNKPLWREAIKTRRGLVLATELGESQGKNRFLMRSEEGFGLGCLYKDWEQADGKQIRSFAVVTRPPHPRFSRYHDKSIPLFLPLDTAVVKEWLDPAIEHSALLDEILAERRLTVDLNVAPVRTYQGAEILGEHELLVKDPQ